ncbi:MAG: alpha/beta hydrolase [Vulcanimicrobiaceae bacterium]
MRGERDLRYGSHERETFDFFPPARAGAPLFVWVHGGYWRRLSKDQFSFVAAPVVAAGGAVAVLNYPLAPGPSLDDIVASVRRGYARALAHASGHGVDVTRTVVGGHSVGAQLAGAIVAQNAVRGALVLSGIYDLEPIRRSSINDWIALDEASARRNSPLYARPHTVCPLVASVGGLEQAEFQRQQSRYVDAWRAWGGSARTIDASQHNHFTIVLELVDARSPLTQALLETMSLG